VFPEKVLSHFLFVTAEWAYQRRLAYRVDHHQGDLRPFAYLLFAALANEPTNFEYSGAQWGTSSGEAYREFGRGG
jgi:hypothetical protein